MSEPAARELAAAIEGHRTQVTPELLTCVCGWYVKRGEGAGDAYAIHLAESLLEPDGAVTRLVAEERQQARARVEEYLDRIPVWGPHPQDGRMYLDVSRDDLHADLVGVIEQTPRPPRRPRSPRA